MHGREPAIELTTDQCRPWVPLRTFPDARSRAGPDHCGHLLRCAQATAVLRRWTPEHIEHGEPFSPGPGTVTASRRRTVEFPYGSAENIFALAPAPRRICGLAKEFEILSCWPAMRVSNERTEWLARNVFPHERAIRVWLRRRLPSGLELDDVIHEMYAKLVALPSVDQIQSPRRYAFRIANSIIVDHRRRSQIVSISSEANLEQYGVPALEPSADQHIQYRQELQHLYVTLDTLPPLCRQAFLLRRLDGLSQRETADRLGISEKTVEKYMRRAVRLLMDEFGRGGKPKADPSYMGGNQSLAHVRTTSRN